VFSFIPQDENHEIGGTAPNDSSDIDTLSTYSQQAYSPIIIRNALASQADIL